MHVVLHAPDLSVERDLIGDIARVDPRIEVTAKPLLADFRTALYRDRDAIGILWTRVENYASRTLRDFREDSVKSPIIVLLQNHELIEFNARVAAFTEMLIKGADDVQCAPLDARELVARLHALARRERPASDAITLPGDAVYRPAAGKIFFGGNSVWLTAMEAALLDLLLSHPNVIFSREMLLEGLYGGRGEPDRKIVDIFICKLRKKLLHALGGVDIIETVWGRGYRYLPAGFTPIVSDHRVRRTG